MTMEMATPLNPPRRNTPMARRPVKGSPWFVYPLSFIDEMVEPLTHGIRTLPDAQLAAETEQLVGICSEPGVHHGESLLLAVYRAEAARRTDPGQSFDAELEQALCRLESQTNATDRDLVTSIGRKIYRAGGRPALESAYHRIVEAARPARREARKKVLAKRWAGIAP